MVPIEIEENLKFKSIDSNEINLSYCAWKGTTFWRKMMLFNKIQYIPREFVQFEPDTQVLNRTDENISDTSMSYMKMIQRKNNKVLSIQDQDPARNDLTKKPKDASLDSYPYGNSIINMRNIGHNDSRDVFSRPKNSS